MKFVMYTACFTLKVHSGKYYVFNTNTSLCDLCVHCG